MAGWRRISHDAIRAAGVGAPRRAGVGVAVQARRQVITTLPYRAGSFITPPPILPTQTRYFWNTSRQDETMASATSFFDFKPKDSTSAPHPIPSTHSPRALPSAKPPHPTPTVPPTIPFSPTNNPRRARHRIPPLAALQQSRPGRQHRLQMRLHPSVRRAGETLQGPEGAVPQRLRNHRLPLQPVRRPGSRQQR